MWVDHRQVGSTEIRSPLDLVPEHPDCTLREFAFSPYPPVKTLAVVCSDFGLAVRWMPGQAGCACVPPRPARRSRTNRSRRTRRRAQYSAPQYAISESTLVTRNGSSSAPNERRRYANIGAASVVAAIIVAVASGSPPGCNSGGLPQRQQVRRQDRHDPRNRSPDHSVLRGEYEIEHDVQDQRHHDIDRRQPRLPHHQQHGIHDTARRCDGIAELSSTSEEAPRTYDGPNALMTNGA